MTSLNSVLFGDDAVCISVSLRLENNYSHLRQSVIALLREGDTEAFRAYSEKIKWRSAVESFRLPDPKYSENVRRLLRRQLRAFVDAGQDPAWIKANRQIDRLLEYSHPKLIVYPRFHRLPAEIVHEFKKHRSAAMEVTRLLLMVLTSPEARQMRRCKRCRNIFIGRPNKKYCSRLCLEKNFASGKAFKEQRSDYMARRRREDAEQIIAWAAKSMLKGEKLAEMLNERLGKRGVNFMINRVTRNWITRHWKEIEKQRRK